MCLPSFPRNRKYKPKYSTREGKAISRLKMRNEDKIYNDGKTENKRKKLYEE